MYTKAKNKIKYCKGKINNECLFNKTVITHKPPITLHTSIKGLFLEANLAPKNEYDFLIKFLLF